ncbi:hypothetical protein [Vibrio harveyi]|uniref:hypothetical protein n=1 Tax=Vibrio harveyi TaxID=669 RepID=UPI003AAB89D8
MISLLLQTIKLITALITLFTMTPFFGAIGSLTSLGFLAVLLVGFVLLIADMKSSKNKQ